MLHRVGLFYYSCIIGNSKILKECIVGIGHWFGHGNSFCTESSFVVYVPYYLSEKAFFLCLRHIFIDQDNLSLMFSYICTVVCGGSGGFVVSVTASVSCLYNGAGNMEKSMSYE